MPREVLPSLCGCGLLEFCRNAIREAKSKSRKRKIYLRLVIRP
jgi:hypothetical protein